MLHVQLFWLYVPHKGIDCQDVLSGELAKLSIGYVKTIVLEPGQEDELIKDRR